MRPRGGGQDEGGWSGRIGDGQEGWVMGFGGREGGREGDLLSSGQAGWC